MQKLRIASAGVAAGVKAVGAIGDTRCYLECVGGPSDGVYRPMNLSPVPCPAPRTTCHPGLVVAVLIILRRRCYPCVRCTPRSCVHSVPTPPGETPPPSVPVGPLPSTDLPATGEEERVANIKSQIKRNAQNEKRRLRNKAVKSELKTFIRTFRTAVASGDKEAAEQALQVASRKLDKAVSKGVIHKNQAAKRKSAIAKAVDAL